MINVGVIGTNWITEEFIKCASLLIVIYHITTNHNTNKTE